MREVVAMITLLTNCAFAFASNPTHEELLKQTQQNQPLFLALLLQQSGKQCDVGIRAELKYLDSDDTAYWAIECKDGNSYMVQIASDAKGSSRITECGLTEQQGVTCFE